MLRRHIATQLAIGVIPHLYQVMGSIENLLSWLLIDKIPWYYGSYIVSIMILGIWCYKTGLNYIVICIYWIIRSLLYICDKVLYYIKNQLIYR